MTWQPAGILVPDIEQVLTGYIRSALAIRSEPYAQDVWVDHELPADETVAAMGLPYPSRIVAVRRDGGGQTDVRDQPRVSIRVWATRDEDATDLAALVNALVRKSPNGNPICSAVVQSGPYPVPEDGPLRLRYSLIELTTRGVQI